MTRVDFFFNVVDKDEKILSIAENVLQRKRKLMVFASDHEAVKRLESLIWTKQPLSFLPNCTGDHPLANLTPIILDWRIDYLPHDDVLINLHSQHPPFFSRFKRLVEIVGKEQEDKFQARERFRFYRDRGYEIRTFDEAI